MKDAHPMMPAADHDEYAEQLFIRDFKMYLAEELDPLQRQLAAQIAQDLAPHDPEGADLAAVRSRLLEFEPYGWWLNFRRASQELLWDNVGRCVDRQLPALNDRGRIAQPQGSLTLDPAFDPPNYIKALDIHLMPGGYARDDGPGSVRQGALMDRGGAVFLLGRNGGLMNDGRGHTLAAHVMARYPDLKPQRLLDMGCGVGPSTVAVAGYFPGAEHHAIDVGGSMLRYAHARAEHLGAAIHFSQRNAGDTRFPADYFDLVYSCILMHETSASMLPAVIREAHRVLRQGGVMVHLEVPMRYEDAGLWGRLQTDFEATYNNEPFWRGATSTDYAALLRELAMKDIAIGYQTAVQRATPGQGGFTSASKGVFGSWFVASARK